MARYKFLKKVPLMESLADDEVAKICGVLDVCDYEQGADIVTQGDEGSTFFIIENGSVDVVRTESETGQSVTLATLKEGNFFGEMSLLNNAPRYASCVASTKEGVRCLSLARHDFELCAKESLQGLLDEPSPATRMH